MKEDTAATTLTRWLAPGTHQFRVRARDNAGNWSYWKAGRGFTLAAYQEVSTAPDGKVSYRGTWASEAHGSHYGGSASYASAGGAAASFSFTGGKQVAWVAPKGPGGGYAYVYLDEVKVATVNLYASSTQYRKVVLVRGLAYDPDKRHTLKVYLPGTKPSASTGTRVDVDAFVVLR